MCLPIARCATKPTEKCKYINSFIVHRWPITVDNNKEWRKNPQDVCINDCVFVAAEIALNEAYDADNTISKYKRIEYQSRQKNDAQIKLEKSTLSFHFFLSFTASPSQSIGPRHSCHVLACIRFLSDEPSPDARQTKWYSRRKWSVSSPIESCSKWKRDRAIVLHDDRRRKTPWMLTIWRSCSMNPVVFPRSNDFD